MSGTVDDFMKRFGGDATIDDREAARYHDRFASGHPDDDEFDSGTYHRSATEYLGKLPPEEFQRGAQAAIATAPPEERQSLLGGLLERLGGGGGLGRIAEMIGLSSADPAKMTSDDGARVLDYARRENPEALQKAIAEKPWFMKAMDHPVLLGVLTMAAAKLFQKRQK